jgi:hypothetical protein
MSFETWKTKSSPIEGRLMKAPEKSPHETLSQTKVVTLKDISLGERHKEASKPLFLIRYE